jgi:hypothetical protein
MIRLAPVPFSFFAANYFPGSYFGALYSSAAACPNPSSLLGQAVQIIPAPGSAGSFDPLTGLIESVVLGLPPGPSVRLSVTVMT